MARLTETRVLSPLLLRNCAPPRITGRAYVYRIYERATNELLYVGCTNDPWRRMREHGASAYPHRSTRFEVDPDLSQVRAELRELIQIQDLKPRDNERMRGSKWREAAS